MSPKQSDATSETQGPARDVGGPNPQLDAEAAANPRIAPDMELHTTPDPRPPAGEPTLTDADLIKANLTEAEAAEIVLAEAKRRHAASGAAEAQAQLDAMEAAARAERQEAPADYVGLDMTKSGSYVYMKLTHPPIAPERTVHLAGTTYEHVAEDADGVWLYRHLG